jgi:hypothetical protein
LDINPKYIARYVEGFISFVNDLKPNGGGELINAVSIWEIDSILEKRDSTTSSWMMSTGAARRA